jgi:hypothetical protein
MVIAGDGNGRGSRVSKPMMAMVKFVLTKAVLLSLMEVAPKTAA